MFVTDDYVLYTAPKCGSSSLVQHLRSRGIKTASHLVHDVHWSNTFSGKRIIVTVRHPRQRLLSMWKHLLREIGNDKNGFERFAFQTQHPDYYNFYKKTLCDWYRPILPYVTHVIRVETFQDDCDRLLGVGKLPHHNKTNHPTWDEELKKNESIASWVESWGSEDIGLFYPGQWATTKWTWTD